MTTEQKIETANAVLLAFARETRILAGPGGLRVEWKTYGPKPGVMNRRWQAMGGNDFYPVWHRHWPHGGTATTALSQLIRWIRGQPVLPLASWNYWASDTCCLLSGDAVQRLADGGYPEHATCVLCGNRPTGLDWWHLNGVSGPCCSWRGGCRQEVKS